MEILPFMPLDDAAGSRASPRPSSVPVFLGGDKRFENLSAHTRRRCPKPSSRTVQNDPKPLLPIVSISPTDCRLLASRPRVHDYLGQQHTCSNLRAASHCSRRQTTSARARCAVRRPADFQVVPQQHRSIAQSATVDVESGLDIHRRLAPEEAERSYTNSPQRRLFSRRGSRDPGHSTRFLLSSLCRRCHFPPTF